MQILLLVSLAIALVGAQFAAGPSSWQFHGRPAHAAAVTLLLTGSIISLCVICNVVAARRIDRLGRFNRRIYNRIMQFVGWLMVLAFAAEVFYVRWPIVPLDVFRLADWPVLAELSVWLPFLLMLLGFWMSGYMVDVRLRVSDMRRRLELGMPVYAAGGNRSVWSLPQYLAFQLRFHLLLVLLPLTAILLLKAAATWLFEHLQPRLEALSLSGSQQATILAGMILAAVLTVIVFSPPLLAVTFSTRPFPAGALLDTLRGVLGRAGARVRRILLWNTHGMVSNAAVMGLWGRLRYVMLSDGLLETLPDEQIEGVFGHELGHVVHHHIIYYLLLLSSLLGWVGVIGAFVLSRPPVRRLVERSDLAELLVSGSLLLALGGGLLLAFGWVSRRFERQADLAGAQAITLGDLVESRLMPAAFPLPEAATAPGSPARPETLDLNCPPHPAAVEIYAAALLRIAEINGLDASQRTWRHGSILQRVAHVRGLCDPARFDRFRGTISLIKLTTLLVAAGGAVLALMGW